MTINSQWIRFCHWYFEWPETGLHLDLSKMDFDPMDIDRISPELHRALAEMEMLEAGGIANPDEGRQVGHYWLRAPELAPTPQITQNIQSMLSQVESFTSAIHSGTLHAPGGDPFTELLLIGIGGSALGPQLVADALGGGSDRMTPHFIDNTDPDGIDRLLTTLGPRLARTLVLVISKSGGTPETRNGMLEIQHAFGRAGLAFAAQAVAITSEGSQLARLAQSEGWLEIFPMWDWVGGRTSVTSAVGLLPAALQGLDIRRFLAGARVMDALTRAHEVRKNPALLLAAAWFLVKRSRGARDMVILPYKDRLILFSRYLQQLVMESLGKQQDMEGNIVHEGLTVYGNKGSTDQHAYMQQLLDGLDNFFATFLVVLTDRNGSSLEIEPGITSGDTLFGLWLGTRQALYQNGRGTLTLSLDRLDASRLGALIALYERAVGFYATLIHVNAYHQPGVERGKRAATHTLKLQARLLDALTAGAHGTAEDLAGLLDLTEDIEIALHILNHLAENGRITKQSTDHPSRPIFSKLRQ